MPKNFQTSQYDEPLCTEGYLDVEVPERRQPADRARRDRAGAPRGGHRQDAARRRRHRPHHRRLALAGRLQPRRHPAGRDRHQAGHRHRPGGRRGRQGLRHRAARRAARPGRQRRADGAGLDALRRQHLAQQARASDWGTRTETKNVNSLRSVERAVRSEVERQAGAAARGRRGSCRRPGTSPSRPAAPRPGRSKEEATDYRYFPEPDLVPVAPDPAWVEQLRGRPARGAVASAAGSWSSSSACRSSTARRWSTPACSTSCSRPSTPGRPPPRPATGGSATSPRRRTRGRRSGRAGGHARAGRPRRRAGRRRAR